MLKEDDEAINTYCRFIRLLNDNDRLAGDFNFTFKEDMVFFLGWCKLRGIPAEHVAENTIALAFNKEALEHHELRR